ncbi:hypothetical protein [Methanopyrus sp. SNP6]|uniref:hypothetical protein n=1 Tax=Methanopyrus sp. SNP6 TaxID=1937005 RepID=UPI001F2061D6|nr:hypothetical protein [Methanopyrus sp. SNP6]
MIVIRSRQEDCRKLLRRALCEVVLREVGHPAFACPIGGPPYCHPRDVGKYRPRGYLSMWDLEAAGRILESGRRYLYEEDLYVTCLVCDLLGPVGRCALPMEPLERSGRRVSGLRIAPTGDDRQDGLVKLALRWLAANPSASIEGSWPDKADAFLEYAEEAWGLIDYLDRLGHLSIPARSGRPPRAWSR